MNCLVLAGTEDGRILAGALQNRGHQVWVSTLTEYGAQIAEAQGLATRYGALDEDGLVAMIHDQAIEVIVDATHPYAEKIHALAQRVCHKISIPYFRWERPRIGDVESPLVHWIEGLAEAGQLACRLGQRIFLSTGSKNLPDWLQVPGFREREIFVRVLPRSEILKQCEELGFKPYQIVAAQGPFSQRFNEALWEQLKIDVVITKDSGSIGGTDAKIKACLNLGIPIIVIKRPRTACESVRKREPGFEREFALESEREPEHEFERELEAKPKRASEWELKEQSLIARIEEFIRRVEKSV